MIVFTILGVAVFWWVMGCIGYGLGMAHDARKGITALIDPVLREAEEVRVLVDWLVINKNGPAGSGSKSKP